MVSDYLCIIYVVEKNFTLSVNWSGSGPAVIFPKGTLIEYGSLWMCHVEGRIRPLFLNFAYQELTAGGFVRRVFQEVNYDFVDRGPALIPRRIHKRILQGASFFIDELEREVRVNQGPPTQAELAELVGETMNWDTYYQAQGSP